MLLKQLLRDSVWYATGLVGAALLELVRVPILGKLLGPVDFGHFALAYGLAALCATASTAWLTTSTTRFLPEYDAKGAGRQGIKLVLRFGAASAVLTFVGGSTVFWLAKEQFDAALKFLWLPTLLLAVTLGSDRIFLSVLRARRQTSRYAVYTIAQSAIALLAGLIWLKASGGGTYEILLPMSLVTFMLLPLVWWRWITQALPETPVQASLPKPIMWWRYGLPLLGVNVLTWIMSYSDRYILQWTGHSDEVGTYAAVHYLSEKSIFLLTYLIGTGVAPVVFAAWERNEETQVAELFTRLLGLVSIAGLPVCLFLAYDPSSFLRLALPASFAEAFAIVPLIAIGALLLGLGNILTEVFTLKKRTALLLVCYVLGASVKLISAWVWAPSYGLTACAWGTLGGYLAFLIATIVLSRPLLRIAWPWPTLARAGVAGVTLLVACRLLADVRTTSVIGLLGWSLTALTAYVLVLFVLKQPELLALWRCIHTRSEKQIGR